MNEVRTIQPVVPAPAARSASSTNGSESKDKSVGGGQALPQEPVAIGLDSIKEAKETAENKPSESVEDAVAKINDYVQSSHRDLQFSVDQDLNQTVVKVVDGGSGELIRQIPEEVFLELARKLSEGGELQLVSTLS